MRTEGDDSSLMGEWRRRRRRRRRRRSRRRRSRRVEGEGGAEGEGGCFLRELTQDLPACHAATISPHTNEPCLSDGRSTIALNHIGKDGNVKTSTKARAAKVLIQLNF